MRICENSCFDIVTKNMLKLVRYKLYFQNISFQLITERNSLRKTVELKSSDIDLVTETDQQVEKLLMDGIRAKYPDHQFIGEEESSEGKKAVLTDAPTWIIDPVDGTMNFVHSFPHSAISVALLINKVRFLN